MLSISPKMQPLSNVSEREDWKISTREYEPFKVPREALPTWAWSIYTPPFCYQLLCQKRVPRGLSAMPSRTVRVWIPTVKTWSQRLSELPIAPGGLSARTPRTVYQGLADRLRVGRGPSGRTSRAVHRSVRFEVNFRLSAMDPTVCPPGSNFFSKNFTRNLRY
jgi:hypothetical protein